MTGPLNSQEELNSRSFVFLEVMLFEFTFGVRLSFLKLAMSRLSQSTAEQQNSCRPSSG